MGTTAQKLQAILDSKADIKDAIEQKGVTVGTTPLSGYAQKILDIPTGGGEDEPYTDDAVRFFDYDGKQLLGMSKADFLALDAMPANPATHEELTFTAWSHTLAEVKNYVSKYDYCDVMALYDTVDGSTRLTMRLNAGDTVPISSSGGPTLDIDWGDGNVETVVDAERFTYHTYADAGDYEIIIKASVKGGLGYGFTLFGYPSSDYPTAINLANKVVEVHYGSVRTQNLRSFKGKGLLYQSGVEYTPYPSGDDPANIKAIFYHVGDGLYRNCYNVRCMVFKENISALTSYVVNNSFMVDRLLIPSGQTTIVGNFAVQCNSVRHIVIPDGVTTIVNSEAFGYCYNCETLYLSKDLTSIGNSAFTKCIKLRELHLPEGLLTIGNNAFFICRELSEVTIPSTVTSIGNSAFNMRYESSFKLTDVYVKPTTPPTLGTSVFPTSGITIHVPQGTLATYQAATNWSAYSSLMIDDIV